MDAVTAARKLECEIDYSYFTRYFFKQRIGTKMLVSGHHEVIFRFIDDVIKGKIKRGIINVPPGYSKTEVASIALMAYGLAINERAKFLHLSYSDGLALDNSAKARLMVKSKEFQAMWPMKPQDDADGKGTWWNEFGGGVRATSTKGQVTGFRAGTAEHSPNNFTGALIIDDPVKPDDAYYDLKREQVNTNYNETIASRVMIEDVPIIVIMQRIHYNDLSGYLLRGGSGEMWNHLNLPVEIDNSQSYPAKYTHGIEYEHGLPNGWLWPFKHREEHRVALESHRRKHRAQYKQDPIERDEDNQVWTEATINKAKRKQFGEATRTVVSIDPAVSNDETSDDHGIIVASKHQKDQYSINKDYTRKGSPSEWALAAIAAYDESNANEIVIETNQGGDMCEQTLRNAGFKGKITRVHASKGKVARAEPVAALYELGYVSHDEGLTVAEDEMMDLDPLTGKAKGKSPNRVDAIVWALSELAGIAAKQQAVFVPSRLRRR